VTREERLAEVAASTEDTPYRWHDASSGRSAYVWWERGRPGDFESEIRGGSRLVVEHSVAGRWHTCRPEGTARQWRKGVDEVIRAHVCRKTGHGEPTHGVQAGPLRSHGGGGLQPYVKAPREWASLRPEESQALHESGLPRAEAEAWAALEASEADGAWLDLEAEEVRPGPVEHWQVLADMLRQAKDTLLNLREDEAPG
jgi:hypothetical protein